MQSAAQKIVLMPVRNEAWILPSTLQALSLWADHIIIADQHSTDGSRSLYSQYPKVQFFDNNETVHSNQVRWNLLKKAREIAADAIIFCIDADEYIPTNTIDSLISTIHAHGKGYAFSLPWIQLWKDVTKYRTDGVWKHNYKTCIWYDSPDVTYDHDIVINDHTSRVPVFSTNKIISVDIPLLHFQYLAWNRYETKQVWYRMSEYINSHHGSRKINYKYEVSKDGNDVYTEKTPTTWIEDIHVPEKAVLILDDEIRKQEIISWITMKGIAFFEPLDIWHVEWLKNLFISTVNREPKSKHYPFFLKKLNSIRRRIM